MCDVWPGPRCTHDATIKRDAAEARMEAALEKFGADSIEYQVAKALHDKAQEEYDATKKGIEKLAMKAYKFPNEVNQRKARQAERTREMQVNAIGEIRNGRVAHFAILGGGVNDFYNAEEIASVLGAAREYEERRAHKDIDISLKPVSRDEYDAALNTLEQRIQSTNGQLSPSQTNALEELRAMEPCDAVNLAAYVSLPRSLDRSQKALKAEINKIAALQSVSPKTAANYYEAYRKQYIEQFADLPATKRPDPPRDWVRGELAYSGYTQDTSSSFAPRDPASLYAVYRLRSDDEAIPDFLKETRSIAAVDLETASPRASAFGGDMHEAMKPEHGRIIEVGIVAYTPKGKPTSTFSQLVRPEKTFLQEHGTGAEEIHKIGIKDLRNAPSWQQIETQVARRVEGKTLIAQNANFEQGWLNQKLNGFQEAGSPFVDTFDIARKHLDLPNYRLPTICGAMSVPYGEGHRAGHDAEVTGQAYFELKRYIRRTWRAKPARRDAPMIEEMPLGSRWDRWQPMFASRRSA